MHRMKDFMIMNGYLRLQKIQACKSMNAEGK